MVLFFIEQDSVIELASASLVIGGLEHNSPPQKALDLPFEQHESLVKVIPLFPLYDNFVLAVELGDEIEKNVFMGQQLLKIGTVLINKGLPYALPLKFACLGPAFMFCTG